MAPSPGASYGQRGGAQADALEACREVLGLHTSAETDRRAMMCGLHAVCKATLKEDRRVAALQQGLLPGSEPTQEELDYAAARQAATAILKLLPDARKLEADQLLSSGRNGRLDRHASTGGGVSFGAPGLFSDRPVPASTAVQGRPPTLDGALRPAQEALRHASEASATSPTFRPPRSGWRADAPSRRPATPPSKRRASCGSEEDYDNDAGAAAGSGPAGEPTGADRDSSPDPTALRGPTTLVRALLPQLPPPSTLLGVQRPGTSGGIGAASMRMASPSTAPAATSPSAPAGAAAGYGLVSRSTPSFSMHGHGPEPPAPHPLGRSASLAGGTIASSAGLRASSMLVQLRALEQQLVSNPSASQQGGRRVALPKRAATQTAMQAVVAPHAAAAAAAAPSLALPPIDCSAPVAAASAAFPPATPSLAPGKAPARLLSVGLPRPTTSGDGTVVHEDLRQLAHQINQRGLRAANPLLAEVAGKRSVGGRVQPRRAMSFATDTAPAGKQGNRNWAAVDWPGGTALATGGIA